MSVYIYFVKPSELLAVAPLSVVLSFALGSILALIHGAKKII